jgi:hypothetical protein
MTVICYDKKYVAADTMSFRGAQRVLGQEERKIIIHNETIFAFTGSVSLFIPMIEWYFTEPRLPANAPKVDDDHGGSLIVLASNCAHTYEIKNPYQDIYGVAMAWGSGGATAQGALDAGANAVRAVALAIEREVWCGGRVMAVDLARRQFLTDEQVAGLIG